MKLKKSSEPAEKVRKALEKFSSKSNRLKIFQKNGEYKYIVASQEIGTRKIRDALVKQGGLSVALAKQITFGGETIAYSDPIPVKTI